MTALVQTGTPQRTRQWNAVIAASIGNALEWFDFVVYGFFAITIARLFFPAADEGTSLLVALATFGVTYFMRPLGAIVLGDYADRHGRKAAFSLSIVLMTLGTGLLPSRRRMRPSGCGRRS
jgi:MHS family proline/betaine transporter-like MFS transporter